MNSAIDRGDLCDRPFRKLPHLCPKIVTEADDIPAAIEAVAPLRGLFFAGRDGPRGHRDFPVRRGDGGDAFPRGGGLGRVALPRLADEMAEIARAEEKTVEARHSSDLLHVRQRLGRLDLE